jgi:hypothetical protein
MMMKIHVDLKMRCSSVLSCTLFLALLQYIPVSHVSIKYIAFHVLVTTFLIIFLAVNVEI